MIKCALLVATILQVVLAGPASASYDEILAEYQSLSKELSGRPNGIRIGNVRVIEDDLQTAYTNILSKGKTAKINNPAAYFRRAIQNVAVNRLRHGTMVLQKVDLLIAETSTANSSVHAGMDITHEIDVAKKIASLQGRVKEGTLIAVKALNRGASFETAAQAGSISVHALKKALTRELPTKLARGFFKAGSILWGVSRVSRIKPSIGSWIGWLGIGLTFWLEYQEHKRKSQDIRDVTGMTEPGVDAH